MTGTPRTVTSVMVHVFTKALAFSRKPSATPLSSLSPTTAAHR